MKIGYYCHFDDKPMAEYEVRVRFKHCLEKLGHTFVEISSNFLEKNSRIHADNLDLDFIFCQETGSCAPYAFADVYSCFCNWVPNGFLVPEGLFGFFANMSKHDIVIGANDSNEIKKEIRQHPDVNADLTNIVPSVPLDFIIKPRKLKDYRIFYIGINLEKIQQGKTRNLELLKYLDKNDKIDIYGPNSLMGVKNLWEGFKTYRGGDRIRWQKCHWENQPIWNLFSFALTGS